MSRHLWVRAALVGIFLLLTGLFLSKTVLARPAHGFGECSRCSCPGFFGFGYTCDRGGCGHDYDDHY